MLLFLPGVPPAGGPVQEDQAHGQHQGRGQGGAWRRERSALTIFVILLKIIILFREVRQKIEPLDFRLSEKGRGDVVSWDFHPGS